MTANLPKDAFLRQYSRAPIWLDQEIGDGGEGHVYSVATERQLAAKMYKHPSEEHRVKLAAMLLNQPLVYHLKSTDMIAWPVDGLVNEQGEYVGFLMPLVDRKRNVALSQVYNPTDRYKTVPNFTWRDLLSIAAHIANVVAVLHASNYVVGDLNESNILVNRRTGLITLVDCDSIQVPGTDGEKFRCSVGKAEYMPPDLQGVAFDEIDRLPAHDNFGLAILIFMLLMEGQHPFAGSLPDSDPVPLPQDNIRKAQWPYATTTSFRPPKQALSLDTLPTELQELMQRCFLRSFSSPQERPSAQEWFDALNRAKLQLKCCSTNKRHWYSDHLNACPWCVRKKTTQFDSFGETAYRVPLLPRIIAFRRKRASSVSPPSSTRFGSRRHAIPRRSSPLVTLFGFVLCILFLAICSSVALNALKTQSTPYPISTNVYTPDTNPSYIYTPYINTPYIYTPPTLDGCPLGQIGLPPNCRKLISTKPQAGSLYIVQQGDSLSSIAQLAYGDDSEASRMKIYNANKQVIGKNLDLLRPGEVLYIP